MAHPIVDVKQSTIEWVWLKGAALFKAIILKKNTQKFFAFLGKNKY